MGSPIVVTGDVNAFVKFLTAGNTLKHVEREIRRATIKASLFLVNQLKQKIRTQRGLRPNTPLTLALSPGELTLLKEKNLFDALGFTLKSAFESEVGIPQGRKSTGGVTSGPEELQKVIFKLEKGFTIDLTPQVRAAIIFGLRERGGRAANEAIQGFEKNTGNAKSQIRVKPIKLMSSVFNNTANREKVKRIYRAGLEEAFKRSGAKDGDHRDKP